MLYPFDCNTVYLSNRRDGGGTQAKGPRGGVLAGGAPGAVPSRFRPGLLFFYMYLMWSRANATRLHFFGSAITAQICLKIYNSAFQSW